MSRYVTVSVDEFTRFIENGKVILKGCDLSVLFKDIKILPKNSASDTTQAIVDLNVNRRPMSEYPDFFIKFLQSLKWRSKYYNVPEFTLFIKMHPTMYKTNYKGEKIKVNAHMLYEIGLYKYLSETIIQDRCSPNIMQYISHFECPNGVSTMKNSIDEYAVDTVAQWETMAASQYRTLGNDVHMLVVESGSGKSLSALLKEEIILPDQMRDLQNIVFQVMYTLHQMYLIGVKHNDLHIGNVWIRTLNKPIDIHYYHKNPTNDDQYAHVHIRTKYVVKLYDFDRSTFYYKLGTPETGTTVNPWLLSKEYLCDQVGICNYEDQLYDLYRFSSNFITSVQYAARKQYPKNADAAAAFPSYFLTNLYPSNSPLVKYKPQGKAFRDISFYKDGLFCVDAPGIAKACQPESPIPPGSLYDFNQQLFAPVSTNFYSAEYLSKLDFLKSVEKNLNENVYLSYSISKETRAAVLGELKKRNLL